jgi:hypothetical protein
VKPELVDRMTMLTAGLSVSTKGMATMALEMNDEENGELVAFVLVGWKGEQIPFSEGLRVFRDAVEQEVRLAGGCERIQEQAAAHLVAVRAGAN